MFFYKLRSCRIGKEIPLHSLAILRLQRVFNWLLAMVPSLPFGCSETVWLSFVIYYNITEWMVIPSGLFPSYLYYVTWNFLSLWKNSTTKCVYIFITLCYRYFRKHTLINLLHFDFWLCYATVTWITFYNNWTGENFLWHILLL